MGNNTSSFDGARSKVLSLSSMAQTAMKMDICDPNDRTERKLLMKSAPVHSVRSLNRKSRTNIDQKLTSSRLRKLLRLPLKDIEVLDNDDNNTTKYSSEKSFELEPSKNEDISEDSPSQLTTARSLDSILFTNPSFEEGGHRLTPRISDISLRNTEFFKRLLELEKQRKEEEALNLDEVELQKLRQINHSKADHERRRSKHLSTINAALNLDGQQNPLVRLTPESRRASSRVNTPRLPPALSKKNMFISQTAEVIMA